MSLTLKHGKFYDEAGNVVPLEHGNKEQSEILDRYRNLVDHGEEATHVQSTVANFDKNLPLLDHCIQCLCGELVIFSENDDRKEDERGKCDCGLHYYVHEDELLFIVKLKK